MKDSSEQGPVHGPRLDGFGSVGAVAVHALLADVDLPAAEIGGGWFHGLRVGVKNKSNGIYRQRFGRYPFALLIRVFQRVEFELY